MILHDFNDVWTKLVLTYKINFYGEYDKKMNSLHFLLTTKS